MEELYYLDNEDIYIKKNKEVLFFSLTKVPRFNNMQ